MEPSVHAKESESPFVDDEIVDIRNILLQVWKGRVFILVTMAFMASVGGYMAMKTQLRFASQSYFIFKDGSPSSSLSSIAGMIGFATPTKGGPDISSYYDKVIFSDDFLEKLIDTPVIVSGDTISLESFWRIKIPAEGVDSDYRKFRTLIDRLRDAGYIVFTKDKAASVIILKTVFENPGVSLQVNNRILDLFNDYLLLNSKSQARENRKFIGERLKEVEQDLARSENNLLHFNEKNRDPSSPGLMLQLARYKRDITMNQELFTQLKQKHELAKIDELKENPLLDVIARPSLALRPEPRGLGKNLVLFTGLGLLAGVVGSILWGWATVHFRGKPRR